MRHSVSTGLPVVSGALGPKACAGEEDTAKMRPAAKPAPAQLMKDGPWLELVSACGSTPYLVLLSGADANDVRRLTEARGV